jgi:gliding motility-associated-like protein
MNKIFPGSLPLFFLLWLGLSRLASAQGGCVPCFSANSVVGCAPFTVTLTDCSGAAPNVFYDYGVTGQTPRPQNSYIYNTPGTYQIVQLLNTCGSGGVASAPLTVTVLPNSTPQFNVTLCSNRNVQVNVTDPTFSSYRISFGDGNSVTAPPNVPQNYTYATATPFTIRVNGVTDVGNVTCGGATQQITPQISLPLPTVNLVRVRDGGRVEVGMTIPPGGRYQLLEENSFTSVRRTIDLDGTSQTFVSTSIASSVDRFIYRVGLINPCTNALVRGIEQLGTFNLILGPRQGSNLLIWTPPQHGGFINYTLYRNDRVLATFTDPSQLTYDDTDLECNTPYCYRLEANFVNGRSIAEERCMVTTSVSVPQPVRGLVANVAAGRVQLNWQLPPPSGGSRPVVINQLIIKRIVNGLDSQRIVIPSAQTYSDLAVAPTEFQYCYQISYTDACGNLAPASSKVCTILLRVVSDSSSIDLQWSDLAPQPVTYFIERFDGNGNLLSSTPVSGTNFSDQPANLGSQVVRYRIRAEVRTGGTQGTIALFSNFTEIRLKARLILPNAFSPNQDGLNDTFGVFGTFITTYQLQIFNRWGELIYFTDNINDRWDGRFKGAEVGAGQYAYAIEAQDTQGQRIRRRGILTIIK